MRFFELFFLFSPSWHLQHSSPRQIINDALFRLSKTSNDHYQQAISPSQPFIKRKTPRNDVIKEIFDIPAALLCAEFYKKHYGFGCPYSRNYFKQPIFYQWASLEFYGSYRGGFLGWRSTLKQYLCYIQFFICRKRWRICYISMLHRWWYSG